ncbi:unnamed protein product [Rotaria sp. Silwood2]|nr:unnamed protein product [Rotaria sp. Silwood2]CAF4518921.1 unnamed protein product [Rotaria sp. Silwood2]
MTTNPNLKRSREFSTSNNYHISETESDDISTDEFISQNEDSSDSYASDNDSSDSYVNDDNDIFKHAQPEFVEKNEAFLGLLIPAGAEFSHHQSLVELWDISRSRPIYHATMSLERFKNLLRFLRFDDRQRRDKSDRLAAIRYVFQSFTKQLPRHFISSENITIDEQLVPF